MWSILFQWNKWLDFIKFCRRDLHDLMDGYIHVSNFLTGNWRSVENICYRCVLSWYISYLIIAFLGFQQHALQVLWCLVDVLSYTPISWLIATNEFNSSASKATWRSRVFKFTTVSPNNSLPNTIQTHPRTEPCRLWVGSTSPTWSRQCHRWNHGFIIDCVPVQGPPH